MVIELVLNFRDEWPDNEGSESLTFSHTLTAPDDFEITGGQIFVENPKTSELQRFAFRIDRSDDGKGDLVVLEEAGL